MDKVYLVLETNARNREEQLLHICKTPEGAVAKIRARVGSDTRWTSRFHGTLWNKNEECIKVLERELEE